MMIVSLWQCRSEEVCEPESGRLKGGGEISDAGKIALNIFIFDPFKVG
jgi:hypothetical protein